MKEFMNLFIKNKKESKVVDDIPSIENIDVTTDLKEMIDFIIDNGYAITLKDFRQNIITRGSIFHYSDKEGLLEANLKEITIYKDDKIENTYNYIKEKYNNLKQLLAIKDGSLFSEEVNDLFHYIKTKQSTLTTI